MRNRIVTIALTAVPAVVVLLMIFDVLQLDGHHVFYNDGYTYKTYSDASANGKTEIINESISPGNYSVRYILKHGYVYPFVTLSFSPARLIDLEAFDSIKLLVKTSAVKNIRLVVKNSDPIFTQPDDYLSHIYFVYEITVSENQNEYHVSSDDLAIPEWWFDENNILRNELAIDENFSRVSGIEISTAYRPDLNVEGSIQVNELLFYKSTRGKVMDILLILGVFWVYICVLFSCKYLMNRKKKGANEITVSAHRKLTPPSESSDTEKVLLYIGNNYSDSDLKVAIVSRECGVPKHLVPLIISERFDISFRQYLNTIRLTEAKRLLVETGLLTTEISARVGYKNYEHFHRVFKIHEQVSPAQYRALNK